MTAIFMLALLLAGSAAAPSAPRAGDDLQAYFSFRDYPAGARAAGIEGVVGVRLGIGPDGRVSDCAVTANSGAASLDAATCRILRERASFRPARGVVEGIVAWRLPPGTGAARRPVSESVVDVLPDEVLGRPGPGARRLGPFPPRRTPADLGHYFRAGDYPASALAARREGEVGYQVTVGANGRVSHCRVTRSSGDAALDAATCRVFRTRVRYAPARDPRGGTMEGVETGSYRWRLPPP